jgi:hypothetical protein
LDTAANSITDEITPVETPVNTFWSLTRYKEANWLPAPKGPFVMALRLYWPKEEAMSSKWTAPPLQQVNKSVK